MSEEGARKFKPTSLLCLGPLHTLFPLPGMPFSALLSGQIFPLEASYSGHFLKKDFSMFPGS